MVEPDSVNDTVFYEEKTLHYPRGLNLKGLVTVNAPLLVPGEWLPLNNVSATLSSASWADGWAPWGSIIFEDDILISEVAFEVVTTIGSVGALSRPVLYKDDGTGRKPGDLILDVGTVSTETTGVKTLAAVTTIPRGILWYSVIPQGAPTTRATLRAGTDQYRLRSIPATARMFPVPVSTGIVGAAPVIAPAISSSLNVAPSLSIHLA